MYSTERLSLLLHNATYVEVPRARYRTKLGDLQELLMTKADGMDATLAPLDIWFHPELLLKSLEHSTDILPKSLHMVTPEKDKQVKGWT